MRQYHIMAYRDDRSYGRSFNVRATDFRDAMNQAMDRPWLHLADKVTVELLRGPK